jgi:hypothetical protein
MVMTSSTMRTVAALLCLFLGLASGCASTTTATLDGGAADSAYVASDAGPMDDAGCLSYARPTGTCTAVGVCCVSSTCIDGICR